MQFQWDPKKAQKNFRKHGVSFDEAITVFADKLAITIADPDHSLDEPRMLTTGISRTGKLIIVSHTDRAEAIRIISAREVSTGERKQYETGE